MFSGKKNENWFLHGKKKMKQLFIFTELLQMEKFQKNSSRFIIIGPLRYITCSCSRSERFYLLTDENRKIKVYL